MANTVGNFITTGGLVLNTFNAGILDGYWGVGIDTNTFNPGNWNFFPPVNSPFQTVTTRAYAQGFQSLFLNNAVGYANQFSDASGSNILNQIVFLNQTNESIANSVYFTSGYIAIQWQWSSTNLLTRQISTNYLTMLDDFGETTNLSLALNGSAGPNPTYIPINYSFFQGAPLFTGFPAATPADSPLGLFLDGGVTNQYASYEAILSSATSLPTDVAHGNYTNMAGRIEIRADDRLDLTHSKISSLNYLLLKSTNQFVGNTGAQVMSPNLDLDLGSTNGSLVLTNLVLPYHTASKRAD